MLIRFIQRKLSEPVRCSSFKLNFRVILKWYISCFYFQRKLLTFRVLSNHINDYQRGYANESLIQPTVCDFWIMDGLCLNHCFACRLWTGERLILQSFNTVYYELEVIERWFNQLFYNILSVRKSILLHNASKRVNLVQIGKTTQIAHSNCFAIITKMANAFPKAVNFRPYIRLDSWVFKTK